MPATANSARFLFDSPRSRTPWRVIGFNSRQTLSDPGGCELELACEIPPPLASLIGSAGILTLLDESAPMFYHGEIVAAVQGASGRRFTTFHLSVRPKLWQLQFRSGLRIFQDKSVPAIVRQVLEEAGISGQDVQWQLADSYPPRTYCTQYRETDLDFVQRLLADAGLFYFLEHQRDRHVMVIADSHANANAAFKPVSGNPALPYQPASGMVAAQQSVIEFRQQQSLCSTEVALRDFNFEKPALQLQVQKGAAMAGQAASALQQYDYPGFFGDATAGNRIVQAQLQAQQAGALTAAGRSDSPRLQTGRRFTLAQHPRQDFNADYILTASTMTGRQPQVLEEDASSEGSSFALDFHAIPAQTIYRARQRFPRPRIEGVQTAFVTGPDGEEIYTDAHGRIKVQFHWDREGKRDQASSCWVRVAQGWAGNQWGSLVLPRIGQEVLVTFINGDPDQPLVTGSLYNAASTTPYPLPASKNRTSFKSRSTPGGDGFNELRVDDTKGSEQLFVHAEKDCHLFVKNDWREQVGHDANLIVQRNEFQRVQGDQHADVKASVMFKVGRNSSHQIGGDAQIKAGGSLLQGVGREWNLKSGGSLVLDAGMAITLQAGGGKIVLDAGGVAISGTRVRINSGGGGGAAASASPVAPRRPAPVDPGRPGNRIQPAWSNAVHKVEKIPFGVSAAASEAAKSVTPDAAKTLVAPDANMPTAPGNAFVSGLGAAFGGGLEKAADVLAGLLGSSPTLPGLPAIAKWAAGGMPDFSKALAGGKSDLLSTLTESGGELMEQANSLKDSLTDQAAGVKDAVASKAESLISKGQEFIESSKQELLSKMKEGIATVLPEELQALLDVLEDEEFDFSE